MSQLVKATANTKKGERSMEVEVNFGANIQEAIDLFSADAVFATFKAQAIVKLQSFMRSKLDAIVKETDEYTYDDDAVKDAISTWALPTGSRQKVSKLAKIEKLLDSLGIEGAEREALLAKARANEAAPAAPVESDEAE